MVSTYTSSNGIEKPGSGDQADVWDVTANNNYDLIDEAIDGSVTVTLASAGSSGSPTALPIVDGTSSSGRNKAITFDDAADLGATAYVQITPSDAKKIYVVRNSLSGSRDIVLFQGTYSASNAVTIPNGKDMVVYTDGAGTGAKVVSALENLSLSTVSASTPIGVSSGGTGVTSYSALTSAQGLVIGTNTQAYDATLTSIASLGTAADKMLYTTGVDTWAELSATSAGRSLISAPDALNQRATIGIPQELLTTSGTSSAYTLTPSVAVTAYTAGMSFLFRAHIASSASPTLNVSGLGAKDIMVYNSGGTLVGLANGGFQNNVIASVVYDGTQFVVSSGLSYGAATVPSLVKVLDEDDMASNHDIWPPSQKSTKAYVDQLTGANNTWQDVLSSRTHSTAYQNTTGGPIRVTMRMTVGSTGRNFSVSVDDVTYLAIARLVSSTLSAQYGEYTIPDGYYYKVSGSVTSIDNWTEWRP